MARIFCTAGANIMITFFQTNWNQPWKMFIDFPDVLPPVIPKVVINQSVSYPNETSVDVSSWLYEWFLRSGDAHLWLDPIWTVWPTNLEQHVDGFSAHESNMEMPSISDVLQFWSCWASKFCHQIGFKEQLQGFPVDVPPSKSRMSTPVSRSTLLQGPSRVLHQSTHQIQPSTIELLRPRMVERTSETNPLLLTFIQPILWD